jgi:hypothetical protein
MLVRKIIYSIFKPIETTLSQSRESNVKLIRRVVQNQYHKALTITKLCTVLHHITQQSKKLRIELNEVFDLQERVSLTEILLQNVG